MMRIPGAVIGALVIGVPALIRSVRDWGERRNAEAAARVVQQPSSTTTPSHEKRP